MKLLPIGERIAALLKERGEKPSWLADAAGVERSTVTRLVTGKRSNPLPHTLTLLAGALGMSVEQLVAGTDAASRVAEAASLVPRADFEHVRQTMLDYERRAMEAEDRARRAEEEATRERERRIREQTAREHKLVELRTRAVRQEKEAERFKALYVQATTDNDELKAQIAELGQAIDDSRRTTRIASILAGTAATASVLTYVATTRKN